MTSRFTLLLSMAGVLGLGCSSPAEGDGGDDGPGPAPTNRPAFADAPQNPAPAAGGSGGQLPVTPEQPPVTPVVNNPPVTPQGTAGSTGMPATPGAIVPGAPGSGLALTPVAGWVAAATNEVGIQGSFFPLTDASGTPPGTTTITPADDFETSAGSTICVSGTASQVIGEAYGQYWGGGIGFNLADPGGMMGPQPWTRGKVVGFSFNVTGTGIPPAGQFRFGANFYDGATINQDSCVNIVAGANTIRFDQIVNQCWTGGLMSPPLSATVQLQSLQWQVATVTTAPTPFNFCVENLRAITAP